MSTEFNFIVIDANQRVEKQQVLVRQLVSERIDLRKIQTPQPAAAAAAARREPET